MRTLNICNLKGGVGKTITAVNLAYVLVKIHKKKILLVRLFILFMVNVIILLLNKLNKTGKMNMLKSSEKDYLDGLGALVGTTRLPASAARAVIQIKLSAQREQETNIPQGTRVSPESNIYFATSGDVIIPAGETSAQVTAVCTQTGEIGKDFGETSGFGRLASSTAAARFTPK